MRPVNILRSARRRSASGPTSSGNSFLRFFSISNVRLAFSPVDVGDGDPLPRGVVHLPARGAGQDDGPSEWVWAEAWWATSNRHPDFFTVLTWSVRYLWQIMRRLRSATAQRWYRLFPGHNAPDSTAPLSPPGWSTC